ncbi:MAG: hypothetical protein WBQ57_13280, partial [Rhodanobacteraceae bacterium]
PVDIDERDRADIHQIASNRDGTDSVPRPITRDKYPRSRNPIQHADGLLRLVRQLKRGGWCI